MIIKQLTSLAIYLSTFSHTIYLPAQAGQPVVWETSGRTELLRGDSRGVSISDTGVLMLAPKLTEVFNTQQTYVWSSAVDNQGNVFLGTGHDGKILQDHRGRRRRAALRRSGARRDCARDWARWRALRRHVA